MHAALVGFALGFFVALQLGPMSLLLIRCTLRSGWRVGVAVGAGIATIDGLYAACGAAGAVPFLEIRSLRLVLGIVGSAVLIWLGLRTLWSAMRVRLGGEADIEVETPRRAFMTALAGTASNPATIISWGAIFAAASVGGSAGSGPQALALIAGVTLGSLSWVTILAGATAVVRRAVGERATRAADLIAGLGLLGFGGVLAYGTAHRER